MNPSPFHLLISFWKNASFASSVMLKISSAESFEWNVTITSSNFVFIFSQSNRNNNLLTRDSALQTVFSTMLLYCFFKSAHVLPAQKEISFFSRYAVLSKNNQIRNSCDTFQRNQTPGFPMLIFPTKNKYYFHSYFHGTIFLRFKKI